MKTSLYPRSNLISVLMYPMNFSSLVLLFCAALFISAALTDIFLAIVTVTGFSMFTLWFIKYAFLILRHTAEGYPTTPAFGDAIIRPMEDFRPAKLIIVIAIHFMIITELFIINSALGYSYGIMLIIILPAIVSSLAMENRLAQLFNIKELTSIIVRSGNSYWFSFVLYCLIGLLLNVVYKSDLAIYLAVSITLYLTLVSFHVIGLSLYRQRKELGYVTACSPEQKIDTNTEERLKRYQVLATNVYSRYRQPSALHYLVEQLKCESFESYEWFYHEIMTWEIKPKFKRSFVEAYICKLNKDNLTRNTINLFNKYLSLDQDFEIVTNATRLCLLESALKEQNSVIIEQYSTPLLNNKEDSVSHKKTLMLLLKYYVEQQPNDYKANQLLNTVITTHPDLMSNEVLIKYKNVLRS